MGRLSSWVRRLERNDEGSIIVPQKDGTSKRFTMEQAGQGYLAALDRSLGRTTDKSHPFIVAIKNAAAPQAHGIYSDLLKNPRDEPPEDLSE